MEANELFEKWWETAGKKISLSELLDEKQRVRHIAELAFISGFYDGKIKARDEVYETFTEKNNER